jgi:hypothetical protein
MEDLGRVCNNYSKIKARNYVRLHYWLTQGVPKEFTETCTFEEIKGIGLFLRKFWTIADHKLELAERLVEYLIEMLKLMKEDHSPASSSDSTQTSS